MMIKMIRTPSPNRSQLWLLGVIVALGALTKQGALTLFPLAIGTIFVAEWAKGGREAGMPALIRTLRTTLQNSLIFILPTLLIAGWWYWRNIKLYGDLLGWSAFFEVLGVRGHPASLAQLWDERWGFMLSYWGLFGGVNVPMANWIYHLLNGVVILGVITFPLVIWQRVRTVKLTQNSAGNPIWRWFNNLLHLVEQQFPLLICLLLSSAVIYGLIRWATFTWSSQGRLVFTAISALNVLLTVGLVGWMPAKFGRWLLGGLLLFLFTISLLAPFLWIRPAYALPDRSPQNAGISDPIQFTDGINLINIETEPDWGDLKAGDSFDLWLTWQITSSTTRNWSVFVQIIDPVIGRPIAQRDMYPGRGLLPTSLLKPGDFLRDYYHLELPATAIAPAKLTVQVGFYDYETNERMAVTIGDDAKPTDSAIIGKVNLVSTPGTVPNPLSINFGNALELVGFNLEPRVAQVGETVELTLFWQPLHSLQTDYIFFAQVLGKENHRWSAIDKSPPAGTTSWQEGEVQSVTMPLTLDTKMPADVFPIIIGAYTRPDEVTFDRLQIVTPDGRITQDDFLQLTLIRTIDDGR